MFVDEYKLREVMAAVFQVPADSIDADSSMDNVKSWDSLHHMNLVLALEEEFGVSIPDDDAAGITSFRLIKLVLGDLLQGK